LVFFKRGDGNENNALPDGMREREDSSWYSSQLKSPEHQLSFIKPGVPFYFLSNGYSFGNQSCGSGKRDMSPVGCVEPPVFRHASRSVGTRLQRLSECATNFCLPTQQKIRAQPSENFSSLHTIWLVFTVHEFWSVLNLEDANLARTEKTAAKYVKQGFYFANKKFV